MVRVVTVKDIKKLLEKVTLKSFFLKLIDQVESDYGRWQEFQKAPRYAIYFSHGVIELMPISDRKYCAFKYVNGHPGNPMQKKQTVIATGQLSLVENGYPVLISEMTVLTAIRTAATSALVSKYLAKKNAKTFGIIGCGAQSEFQTLAHHFALGIRDIFYFDTDAKAMAKFQKNLKPFKLNLHPCEDGKTVVIKSDIVTTATAQYGHHKIVRSEWVKKGCHLNKIGGDSPGKTELDAALLSRAKIVVELLDQTQCEGEIQQDKESKVYAEIWELVTGKKKGRVSGDEITLFDSVGFALEDYSALRLVYAMAEKYNIGRELDMVPNTPNPKNLFGVLGRL